MGRAVRPRRGFLVERHMTSTGIKAGLGFMRHPESVEILIELFLKKCRKFPGVVSVSAAGNEVLTRKSMKYQAKSKV